MASPLMSTPLPFPTTSPLETTLSLGRGSTGSEDSPSSVSQALAALHPPLATPLIRINRTDSHPFPDMNCAPITVKAGASSKRIVKDRRAAYSRRQSAYPDLFLANIGEASNGCDTSEALAQQVAIQYPSPGGNVLTPNGPDGLFKQPCDGNPRNNGGGGGSAPAATGGAAPSATGAGAAGPAPTTSASGQAASDPSGSAS